MRQEHRVLLLWSTRTHERQLLVEQEKRTGLQHGSTYPMWSVPNDGSAHQLQPSSQTATTTILTTPQQQQPP
eukprot:4869876-Amphidinium_carterae.1